jgi:hypothetical protein
VVHPMTEDAKIQRTPAEEMDHFEAMMAERLDKQVPIRLRTTEGTVKATKEVERKAGVSP